MGRAQAPQGELGQPGSAWLGGGAGDLLAAGSYLKVLGPNSSEQSQGTHRGQQPQMAAWELQGESGSTASP